MNDGDAVSHRVSRTAPLNGDTIEDQLAFIRLFDACENPHQCGLSSAILTDQYIDLVLIYAVGDLVERNRAGISSDDAARLQNDFIAGLGHAGSVLPARAPRTASFQP